MVGFDIDKTIQAVAYLIKQSGGKANYMRLLKLIYLADRKSLEKRKMPICGDSAYAMRRGPVPSRTLDMIKGTDPESSRWDEFIRRDNYHIVLVNDPGNLALSRAELSVLEETFEEFGHLDEWKLVDWCHDNLPEYEDNWNARGKKNSVRIPLDDVLNAIGLAGKGDAIIQQINENNKFAALFGDHMPNAD